MIRTIQNQRTEINSVLITLKNPNTHTHKGTQKQVFPYVGSTNDRTLSSQVGVQLQYIKMVFLTYYFPGSVPSRGLPLP